MRKTLLAVLVCLPLAALAIPTSGAALDQPVSALAAAAPAPGTSEAAAAALNGAGTAPVPQPVVTPSADPLAEYDLTGIAKGMTDAAKGRKWLLLAAYALAGLLLLARRYAGKLAPKHKALAWLAFFTTDRGGVALALLGGIVSVLLAALKAGAEFNPEMLIDGVVFGITSAGGYVALKKLIWPSGADKATEIQQTANVVAAATAGDGSAAAAAAALNEVGNKEPKP